MTVAEIAPKEVAVSDWVHDLPTRYIDMRNRQRWRTITMTPALDRATRHVRELRDLIVAKAAANQLLDLPEFVGAAHGTERMFAEVPAESLHPSGYHPGPG